MCVCAIHIHMTRAHTVEPSRNSGSNVNSHKSHKSPLNRPRDKKRYQAHQDHLPTRNQLPPHDYAHMLIVVSFLSVFFFVFGHD